VVPVEVGEAEGVGVEEREGVGDTTVWVAVGVEVVVGETTGVTVELGTAVSVGEPPITEKFHQVALSR
jgi:hypothetical protein